MSTENVLIGTLSGLAVGLAVGFLTAPAKGSDTRQQIADATDNIKKKFLHLRGQAADELDELKEVFEQEVAGLKDDVRQRVLTLIEASKASKNHSPAKVAAN
jgi:gas vesicle protein